MVTCWRCLGDEYANMCPLPCESESAIWECASSFSSSSFAIRFSSCQPQLILIGRVVLWDSFLRQSRFNWHFYIFGRHWQSFEDDVCPRIEFGDPPSPSDDGLEFPSQLLSSSLQLNMLLEDRWPQTNSPPEMESCSRVLEVKTLQGAKQEQTYPRIASKHHPAGKKLWLLGQWKNIFWR